MKKIYLRATVDLLWANPETKTKAQDIINESVYKKIKDETIEYFIVTS